MNPSAQNQGTASPLLQNPPPNAAATPASVTALRAKAASHLAAAQQAAASSAAATTAQVLAEIAAKYPAGSAEDKALLYVAGKI